MVSALVADKTALENKFNSEKLSEITAIKFIQTSDEVAPWFNDILVDERDALQAYLKEQNIGSRPFYPAIHTQSPYSLHSESYPNAEFFAHYGLWLPSYAQLTEQEIEKIAHTICRKYQQG